MHSSRSENVESRHGGRPSGHHASPTDAWLAPEILRIVQRRELIVALMAYDTPPFVKEVDGQLAGIDIDLANRIGRALSVPVTFNRSAPTYDSVIEAVASGRADIGMSKLLRTLQRAKAVLFSQPYMLLSHGLLVHRQAFERMAAGRPDRAAVRGFDGSLGVIAHSAWVELAEEHFPQAKVLALASWDDACEAARAGTIVAAYRDALAVGEVFRRDPSLARLLRAVTFADEASGLSVMVGHKDNVLLSFINEVIAQQPGARMRKYRP